MNTNGHGPHQPDIVQGVLSYLNSPDYERRARREDQQLFTQVEMTTRGQDDLAYAGQWMEQLKLRMGKESFASWLASYRPGLDTLTDAELRQVLFTKLQEVI